jgi:hypothetical protein
MMRPNTRKKQQVSGKASEVIPSSYYDLVMEDIDGFLQKTNAHTFELREFLGLVQEVEHGDCLSMKIVDR